MQHSIKNDTMCSLFKNSTALGDEKLLITIRINQINQIQIACGLTLN